MDSDEIVSEFLMIMNAYSEKMGKPEKYGDQILYTAEMHLLETIGNNPNMRTTEIAEEMGLTKGRISQLTKVLLKKKMIESVPGRENKKEILFSLTKAGKKAFLDHASSDREIIAPIIDYLNSLTDKDRSVISELFMLTYSRLTSAK
jgi:DNA-binding MarR family transcriptional regulator